MVIKPDDVAKKIIEDQGELMEALEKDIDNALYAEFDPSTNQSVTVHIKSDIKKSAVQAVMNKFTAAGWSVVDKDDQREGRYLSIRKAPQRPCSSFKSYCKAPKFSCRGRK